MFSFVDLKYHALAYHDLMLDDTILCRAYSDSTKNVYDSVGCTAIIDLKLNQKVFVKLLAGRVYSDEYASFTGARLGQK